MKSLLSHKIRKVVRLLSITCLLIAPSAFAETAVVGSEAPNFTLTDTNGTVHSLEDFRGKFVVLEWLNHDCPFVAKYYEAGKMQELQREHKASGGVWLSVVSSAPGKQGYFTPEEGNELAEKKSAAPTGILLDSDGEVGKMYGAKTTPHMYVINPEGQLIYAGAIDDKPTTKKADLKSAHNYVMAALSEAKEGKPITNASTVPYGCSIKYQS